MDILGSNYQRYIEIQQVTRSVQFRTASEFTLSIKKTGGHGDLKKKCILRLAKAKMKMEKKMTLPNLLTPLCCSASNQHKAQLTTTKKDGGRVLKKGMHFLFLE